jgi:hypothetical protein
MTAESKRLVAVCDVMGFSRLIRSIGVARVLDGPMQNMFRILENNITQEEPSVPFESVGDLKSGRRVGVAWFSDTILLFALDDSDLSCSHVIESVGWLIFRSFFTPQTRIRAGISYGDFFAAEDRNLFLGNAMIDAMRKRKPRTGQGELCLFLLANVFVAQYHNLGIIG